MAALGRSLPVTTDHLGSFSASQGHEACQSKPMQMTAQVKCIWVGKSVQLPNCTVGVMDTSKSTFSKQGKAGVADHITFDQSAIGICGSRGVPLPLSSWRFECFRCGNWSHPAIEHAPPDER